MTIAILITTWLFLGWAFGKLCGVRWKEFFE